MNWIAWVEYSYNTSFRSSLGTTPFEVVYGRPPPRLLTYCLGISKLDVVDIALQNRDEILRSLKQNLRNAQLKMKAYFNAKHRELEFQVGDKVLLKLPPCRQLCLAKRRHQKLLSR